MSVLRMSTGRSFQIVGPETVKHENCGCQNETARAERWGHRGRLILDANVQSHTQCAQECTAHQLINAQPLWQPYSHGKCGESKRTKKQTSNSKMLDMTVITDDSQRLSESCDAFRCKENVERWRLSSADLEHYWTRFEWIAESHNTRRSKRLQTYYA